jgi:hypothetical protein
MLSLERHAAEYALLGGVLPTSRPVQRTPQALERRRAARLPRQRQQVGVAHSAAAGRRCGCRRRLAPLPLVQLALPRVLGAHVVLAAGCGGESAG